jgi:hypothetical protein
MTEIVCILDRSGSMHSLQTEVIGSFNSFVEEQRKILKDRSNTLTLVLFDDKYEMVYERIPLEFVPKLTASTYFTRGMTSLFDAIGKTVNSINPDKKKVLVLIQTDGQENSSSEYKSQQIKELIKSKEKIGWEFNFIGAGPDAFEQGQQFNGIISSSNQKYTDNTARGVREGFNFMNKQSIAYCSR